MTTKSLLANKCIGINGRCRGTYISDHKTCVSPVQSFRRLDNSEAEEPTVKNKTNKGEEPNNKWRENIGRRPWMYRAAPSKAQEEEEDTSNEQGDASKVHGSHFILDGAVVVELFKLRRVIEQEEAKSRSCVERKRHVVDASEVARGVDDQQSCKVWAKSRERQLIEILLAS